MCICRLGDARVNFAFMRVLAVMVLANAAASTGALSLGVTLALAGVGAGIGSLLRDALVRAFRERAARADLGILAANLIACIVVGASSMCDELGGVLLIAGFSGGLSTWSGLALEVAGAWRARWYRRIVLHLAVALLCAIALFVLASKMQGLVAQ